MLLAHVWRSWKGAKGVALLAIVAFAVGIGAATAVFTVINSVMLKPLPYPDGETYFGGTPRLIANGPTPWSWITVTPFAPPKCVFFAGRYRKSPGP